MSTLEASPVRVARLAIHKTIAEASEAAGIHWQTWFLTEQGCYEEVPGRIMDYLGRLSFAEEEYYQYRFDKQKAFGERYSLVLPPVDLHKSPVQSIRESLNLSRASFAKSLAVQVAHLYNCEKGRARFLPSSLREALQNAGLPVESLDELDERQEEFYEWLRHSPTMK